MKKRLLDILKAYCKTERMKTMKIQKVLATEILDSRGTPTVGATVILSDGSVGTANAPSGASTGKFEAHEKRDNDRKRYHGRGVKKAVEGIEETVAPVLENMQRVTVQNIDKMLIELDNTKSSAQTPHWRCRSQLQRRLPRTINNRSSVISAAQTHRNCPCR